MIKASDLKRKEVINITDGKSLGLIYDLEVDAENGEIRSIIVPGGGKFFSFFGRNDDLIIAWDQVVKIGIDVILVEIRGYTDPGHRNHY